MLQLTDITRISLKAGASFDVQNRVVFFQQEDPDAWEELMSKPCAPDACVQIYGTRIVSGNGAIDGLLKPCYAARRERVNAARKAVGLSPIAP